MSLEPHSSQPAHPDPTSPWARASLAMGIIAIPTACVHGCGTIMGVGAITFGVLALRDISRSPPLRGRWMAIIGISLGGVFMVISLSFGLWLFNKFTQAS